MLIQRVLVTVDKRMVNVNERSIIHGNNNNEKKLQEIIVTSFSTV